MRQPSIFLPHGGGPCFFMDPPPEDPTRWAAMERYLRSIPFMLPQKPAALLVISAHWEMRRPTVLASAKPGMLYDYYNFPPHTYRLTYPAPGAPVLAAKVRGLLTAAGIDSGSQTERGYDHGVFVPMKVSFPDAEVPILQLSLQADLDPALHIAVGHALSGLRDENVLILGSGSSFHNLRSGSDPALSQPSLAFDDWLTETVCDGPVSARASRLAAWSQAPGGRLCHPREEHLLPLMVAAGAADGDAGRRAFTCRIWGKAFSAYHFS